MSAWAETVKQALFDPVKLFGSARLDRTGDHFSFAILTASVFSVISQLLQRLLSARSSELVKQVTDSLGGASSPLLTSLLQRSQELNSPGWVALFVVLTPLFSVAFLYANAGVTHLFALLFGQSRRGFAASFTACAYACAPLVLLAVPGCGSIIAVVWMIVAIGIGLRATHGISAGGASATVLAPYLVLCCACGVAVVMVALSVKQAVGAP